MELLFDKFALSSNDQENYQEKGYDAENYADKDHDISLSLETTAIVINDDTVASIPITITNNHADFAASNVQITLQGELAIEAGTVVTGCLWTEEGKLQSLICAAPNLSPSQSIVYDFPVSVIGSGEYDVTLSVSAEQSDANLANNQVKVSVKVSSLAAAVSSAGSGGSLNWVLLIFLSLGFGLRKVD